MESLFNLLIGRSGRGGGEWKGDLFRFLELKRNKELV